MARLAYANGPGARGGRGAPRGRRRERAGRSSPALGYLVVLLLAAAAVAFERLDLPTSVDAPAAPVNWPSEASASAGYRGVPVGTASVRVVDGDTLDVEGERVRLANIDAPEMPPKSKCAAEADGALAATARLETLVSGGGLTLERTGVDRYGRTLAHVYAGEADVGRSLIAAGLVRPWEGRRRSWCI